MKLSLLFLALWLVSGCSSEDKFEPPFPVIDSGYWAERHLPNEIQWLDDERVLFVGKKADAGLDIQGLHVWHLRSEIRSYRERTSGLCLRGDTTWYTYHPATSNEHTFYQGKFGEELPHIRQRYSDNLNCRTLPAYPGSDVRQTWKLLLDGHGYLNVGKLAPFDELPPVWYHPSKTSQPIAMPFNRRQIIFESTYYYPFKDAYLLYGAHDNENQLVGREDLSQAKPHAVWWLHPDGQVEVVEMPAGPWVRGGSTFMVGTRKGIVIVFHGGEISPHNPGTQGAYLVAGQTITRLLEGFITAPAVSPDGCRVALFSRTERVSRSFRQK